MAGEYTGKKFGYDALKGRLDEMQRQIDAMAGGSNLASATIGRGGLTVFDETSGGRMYIGQGNILLWQDYTSNPTGYGRIYCDPGGSNNYFRMFPPYAPGEAYLNNSITMQGARTGLAGNMWLYSDGNLSLTTQDENANPAGSVIINTPVLGLFNLPTTGSAANLRLDTVSSVFSVRLVTSSLRYKQDVEDAEVDPEAFLKLRPRTWRDKGQVESDPDTTDRYIGFIAEEVDELGLPFVDYDDQDRPDSLQYDRFMVGALAVMKQQASQIADLTSRLEALEGKTK